MRAKKSEAINNTDIIKMKNHNIFIEHHVSYDLFRLYDGAGNLVDQAFVEYKNQISKNPKKNELDGANDMTGYTDPPELISDRAVDIILQRYRNMNEHPAEPEGELIKKIRDIEGYQRAMDKQLLAHSIKYNYLKSRKVKKHGN